MLSRLLVDPHHIPARIAKSGRNLGRIRADGLHDFTAARNDLVRRCCRAVHHYVNEEARRSSGRTPEDPGAAHFADSVVEGCAPIPALADLPAEHLPIEFGRPRNVRCRNLDVADFPVRKGRWHQ